MFEQSKVLIELKTRTLKVLKHSLSLCVSVSARSGFHGNRKNGNGDKNVGAEVLNANIIFALTLSHRTAREVNSKNGSHTMRMRVCMRIF